MKSPEHTDTETAYLFDMADVAVNEIIESTPHPRFPKTQLARIAFGSSDLDNDLRLSLASVIYANPLIKSISDEEYQIVGRDTEINIDMTELHTIARDLIARFGSHQPGIVVSKAELTKMSEDIGYFFIKEERSLLLALIAGDPAVEKIDDDLFRIN
jgi:hypothetical protein